MEIERAIKGVREVIALCKIEITKLNKIESELESEMDKATSRLPKEMIRTEILENDTILQPGKQYLTCYQGIKRNLPSILALNKRKHFVMPLSHKSILFKGNNLSIREKFENTRQNCALPTHAVQLPVVLCG